MRSTGWKRKVRIDGAGVATNKLEAVQVAGGYLVSTRRTRVRMMSASSRKPGESTGKSTSWMAASNARVKDEVTPVRRRSVLVEAENLGSTDRLVKGAPAGSSSWTCGTRRSWVEGTKGHRGAWGLEVLWHKHHSLRI